MSDRAAGLAWELHRQFASRNLADLVKDARTQETPLSLDDIYAFAAQSRDYRDRVGSEVLVARDIPAFLARYLADLHPRTVLDPWAGLGAMLLPVLTDTTAMAVGLEQNTTISEIAQAIASPIPVDWRVGNSLQLLDSLTTQFDVVLSAPPLGFQPQTVTIDAPDGPVELRDDLGNLVVLKAALQLASEGVGCFLVSPKFLTMEAGRRTVRANLARFGLYLDAAIACPAPSRGRTIVFVVEADQLSPSWTTASFTYLVFLRRTPSERLFVGQLSSDHRANSALLANLKARRGGKTLQAGVLVEESSFRSFGALVAENDTERLARSTGLTPTPLAEYVTAINLVSSRGDKNFDDIPNSVYLPIIGRSSAVTALSDLRLKPHNYVQLVLNPEKAHADYVAQFFSTSLGQKVRESLLSGTTIPKVSKAQLNTAAVYLPDLPTQTKILRINAVITDLSTQVETYQRELWSHPKRANAVEKAVKTLNREDSVESWTETLPFPLAIILWKAEASSAAQDKVKYLLHFFEALAEFTATVLLSAAASNKEFYAEESHNWLDRDPKYQTWFVQSDFGGWKILGARLAKCLRRLRSAEGGEQRITALFGLPDGEFLTAVTNTGLFNILDDVVNYRNRWVGHTGAANDRLYQERRTLLEVKVADVRHIIADRYASLRLLSPKHGDFDADQGDYHYQVRVLQGTKYPFRAVTVQTRSALDSKRLYLLHEASDRPLLLLPFFRLMEAPRSEQNTVYFYNRLDGNGVRWVSYYFDTEPELVRQDPDAPLQSALALLRGEDTVQGGTS